MQRIASAMIVATTVLLGGCGGVDSDGTSAGADSGSASAGADSGSASAGADSGSASAGADSGSASADADAHSDSGDINKSDLAFDQVGSCDLLTLDMVATFDPTFENQENGGGLCLYRTRDESQLIFLTAIGGDELLEQARQAAEDIEAGSTEDSDVGDAGFMMTPNGEEDLVIIFTARGVMFSLHATPSTLSQTELENLAEDVVDNL